MVVITSVRISGWSGIDDRVFSASAPCLIEQREHRPRDAFEQRPLGLRAGKNADAKQDAEQEAREVACIQFAWDGAA